MRLTAIAAAAALASGLAPAGAAVISTTGGWGFGGIGGYYDQNEPTFDPSLGKLDGVRITVSGYYSWSFAGWITQPPGHVTVLPLTNGFSAWWPNATTGETGQYSSFDFPVPKMVWVGRAIVSYPQATMKLYGTFTQNPALFANDAPVELQMNGYLYAWGCKAPCQWHWTGSDNSFGGYGTITTTFYYTPTPAKVPEPPTWMLLGGAVVALGATRLNRT